MYSYIGRIYVLIGITTYSYIVRTNVLIYNVDVSIGGGRRGVDSRHFSLYSKPIPGGQE